MVTRFFKEANATAIFSMLEERRVARGRRLFQLYMRTGIWAAFESSLRALDQLSQFIQDTFDADKRGVHVLVDRVRADLEEAIDGFLCGVRATVSNSMRDVMEAELLIRLFALAPDEITTWLGASAEELRKIFSPVKVRMRVASLEGLPPQMELPDTVEYQAHSEGLHVTPDPDGVRNMKPSGTLDDFDHLSLEIAIHASRFITAIGSLFDGFGIAASDTPDLNLRSIGDLVKTSSLAQVNSVLPPREPRTRADYLAALEQLKRDMSKDN